MNTVCVVSPTDMSTQSDAVYTLDHKEEVSMCNVESASIGDWNVSASQMVDTELLMEFAVQRNATCNSQN